MAKKYRNVPVNVAFTLKRAQCWSVDIGKIYSILSHLDVPAGGFSEPWRENRGTRCGWVCLSVW